MKLKPDGVHPAMIDYSVHWKLRIAAFYNNVLIRPITAVHENTGACSPASGLGSWSENFEPKPLHQDRDQDYQTSSV